MLKTYVMIQFFAQSQTVVLPWKVVNGIVNILLQIWLALSGSSRGRVQPRGELLVRQNNEYKA